MNVTRKLFEVQQGRMQGPRPHFQARQAASKSWPAIVQNIAIGCIMIIILVQGLKGVTLSNFKAENSGIQGRKYLLEKEGEGDALYSLTDEELAQYEKMVERHLDDIDMKSLQNICGLSKDMDVSMCFNSRGKAGDAKIAAGNSINHSKNLYRRIHVLGERHSGTNAATDLAHANFDLTLVSKDYIRSKFPWVKGEEFRKEFGLTSHKHNIQQLKGYHPGLSIISIRNPYDWARKMMDECYFCGKSQMKAVESGSIEEFLSVPWTDGAHISSNEKYMDIFDLRKKKFCNHLYVAATRSDCVIVVRAEENIMPGQQRAFIQKIQDMTRWALKYSEPKVLRSYLGRSSKTMFNPLAYFSGSVYFSTLEPVTDLDNNSKESARRLVDLVDRKSDESFERALGYKSLGKLE